MPDKTGFYFMFDEWPLISQLPDAQIGKLLRAIVEYEQTGTVIQLPQLASFAFLSVKETLIKAGRRIVKRFFRLSRRFFAGILAYSKENQRRKTEKDQASR